MTQVLDYSLARPDPAQIKAAGYAGVLRYVAPAEDAPKIITAAEYAALRAAGLQVALNWEWYANRTREGAAAGTADAQEALRQANELGYTGALYFSVDYDAPESDQPAINAYFQAAAQVIGLHRLGGYAGYWPLKRLFDAGLISYGWQTLAWSGGNRESRAHLYQTGATAFDNGADINDVLKEDWTGGTSTLIGLNNSDVANYFTPSGDGWQANGFIVRGEILASYQNWPANGSDNGLTALGLPLGNETPVPGAPAGVVYQSFERGVLVYDPNRAYDNPPGSSGPVYLAHFALAVPPTQPAAPPADTSLQQRLDEANAALADAQQQLKLLTEQEPTDPVALQQRQVAAMETVARAVVLLVPPSDRAKLTS